MEVEKLEAEESTESASSHGTVNDIMSEVKEKKFNILSDTSFWDIPVPDYFRFEITKRGSASF